MAGLAGVRSSVQLDFHLSGESDGENPEAVRNTRSPRISETIALRLSIE